MLYELEIFIPTFWHSLFHLPKFIFSSLCLTQSDQFHTFKNVWIHPVKYKLFDTETFLCSLLSFQHQEKYLSYSEHSINIY